MINSAFKKSLCILALTLPCSVFASQVDVTVVLKKGGEEIFRQTGVSETGRELVLRDVQYIEYTDSASQSDKGVVEKKGQLETGVTAAVTAWVYSDGSVYAKLVARRVELVEMHHHKILNMNIDSPQTRGDVVQSYNIVTEGEPSIIAWSEKSGVKTVWEVTVKRR